MKMLIILNEPAYGNERIHDGLRSALSCMEARGLTDVDPVAGAHRSSMAELTTWALRADKVITF